MHRVVTPEVGGSNPPAPAIYMYKEGDIVLVSCIAGPEVYVRLVKRILKPQDYWGADGWEAVLYRKRDADILRKAGVPYSKEGPHPVWVYDEDIIKKRKKGG